MMTKRVADREKADTWALPGLNTQSFIFEEAKNSLYKQVNIWRRKTQPRLSAVCLSQKMTHSPDRKKT